MHTATVTKIMMAMKEHFHSERRQADIETLDGIAKLHNFELNMSSSASQSGCR